MHSIILLRAHPIRYIFGEQYCNAIMHDASMYRLSSLLACVCRSLSCSFGKAWSYFTHQGRRAFVVPPSCAAVTYAQKHSSTTAVCHFQTKQKGHGNNGGRHSCFNYKAHVLIISPKRVSCRLLTGECFYSCTNDSDIIRTTRAHDLLLIPDAARFKK